MTMLKQIADLNAYTLSFDVEILQEVQKVYTSYISKVMNDARYAHLLEGGKSVGAPAVFPVIDQRYFIVSYKEAPLLWVSNNCHNSYNMFKNFFDQLAIIEPVKALIDCDKTVIMNAGFFIVGNHLTNPLWHVDYDPGANGFSLVTPLFPLSDTHGDLLYVDTAQQTQRYAYEYGEAIIFGDNFIHTTEPYPKTSPERVLLSIALSTDKLQYWDILKQTIGQQTPFYRLPCGHIVGTCKCLEG